MKKKILIPLFCLLSSNFLMAQEVKMRGVLSKEGEKFIFKNLSDLGPRSVEIEMDEKFKYTLDEKMVNSPNYVLEFNGELDGTVLKTQKTPTIVGGAIVKSGLLRLENDELYLDNVKVIYGRTKPIYGIPFDEESKNHYLNKQVTVHGDIKEVDGQRLLSINAVLESDLLKVENSTYLAPNEFQKEPFKFVLEKMKLNENSQKRTPWKGTLVSDKSYKPEEGESVLVITLSGRQGDDPGASAGHFAIGAGKVDKDGNIKAETFNFYFEGPKEVLAGNTDLVSYFGHLIQGQQNYRPTYTVFAYGIEEDDLKKVRDLYEKELHKVRTVKGLEITPGYNCTTTSNYALREIGIYGQNHNLGRRMFDVQNLGYVNPLSWWSNSATSESTLGKPRVLSYVLTRDPEHFVPRAAFESFIKNFQSKRWRKRKSIKRVDYLFIPQTPSARQVGGISYDDPIKEGNRIVTYSKKRAAEKMESIKKAQKILLEKDAAQIEEIEWAQKLLEEDQKEVREILNTID